VKKGSSFFDFILTLAELHGRTNRLTASSFSDFNSVEQAVAANLPLLQTIGEIVLPAMGLAKELCVYLLLSLLLLKLLEMITCVLWVVRVKDQFNAEFQQSLKSQDGPPKSVLDRYQFPYFPGNTFLTRWTRKLPRAFHRFLFRYPNLMLVSALLSFLSVSWGTSYILIAVLWVGVWVKAIHLLVYRYKFGAIDNVMQSLSIPWMSSNVNLELVELRGIRNFVRIFPTTILVAIFSYAAIYYKFEVIKSGSLKGITYQPRLSIQALYFSTATFCTVGFGDITPATGVVRLACTSEMILSLTLLVLFVTAFSSTSSLAKH
jgi:hypothetical protein